MWGVALLPHPCRVPCSGSLPPLPAPPTLPDLSRAGLPAGPSSVTSARGPAREGTSPGRSRPPRGPGAGVCRPQCEWEPGSPRPARAAAFTTCWKPARASHARGPHPSARPADPQENEATGRARERNGNAARMPGDPRGPSGPSWPEPPLSLTSRPEALWGLTGAVHGRPACAASWSPSSDGAPRTDESPRTPALTLPGSLSLPAR